MTRSRAASAELKRRNRGPVPHYQKARDEIAKRLANHNCEGWTVRALADFCGVSRYFASQVIGGLGIKMKYGRPRKCQ